MLTHKLHDDRAHFRLDRFINDIGIILAAIEQWCLFPVFPLCKITVRISVLVLRFDFCKQGSVAKCLIFEVRRDRHHFQIVNLAELFCFRQRGACHTGQLLIHTEVILQRDGGVGYVLRLDLRAFLGFHSLVQAIAPAPTRHQASRELIDDHNLPALNKVILIAVKDELSPQSLLQMTAQARLLWRYVFRAIRVHERHAQHLLDARQSHLGDRDVAILFIQLIIFRAELFDDLRHLSIPFQIPGGRTRDNQRRARFVDQHVIDLVNNGVMVSALDAVAQAHCHVVAEIVEAKLGVRAVCDIRLVGQPPIHQTQVALIFMRRLAVEVDDKGFFAVLGDGGHL